MQITKKFLKEWGACLDGYEWFCAQNDTDAETVINKLISENPGGQGLNWSNWVIVRLLNNVGRVKYAVFAAEQVIEIFEKKYPHDNRPRAAIEAAKKYIENPSADAADAAARAAYAAAYAARAAHAAARAAYAAAYAAADAADAAYAAYAAAYAADAAYVLKEKIVRYGIKLLKGQV